MSNSVAIEPAPLRVDADDVIRVGTTRIPLDTIIAAFNEGLSAETIADQYPTLRLADIYSVIAYILNHRSEVEMYLQRRQSEASSVRAENERRFDPNGIRTRLLSRQRGT